MEISIEQQMQVFIGAIVAGCVFGIIYDIFRAVRALMPPPSVIVFLQDVLYAVLCACVCFTYILLMNWGQPRAYIFAGAAIGFVIYFNTVGAVFIKAFRRVTFAVKRALNRFFAAIGGKIKAICRSLWEKTWKVRKKLKKFLLFFKKPFIFLKKCCKILNGRLSRREKRREIVKTELKRPIKSSETKF